MGIKIFTLKDLLQAPLYKKSQWIQEKKKMNKKPKESVVSIIHEKSWD